MPPKGVVTFAQCVSQAQAEFLATQYAVPQQQLEPVDMLGEEPMVLRVRKTPTYWQLENWPRSLLQSEDNVDFP